MFLRDNGATAPVAPQTRVPGVNTKTGKAEKQRLNALKAEQRQLEALVDIGATVKKMFAAEVGGEELQWGVFSNRINRITERGVTKYSTGMNRHTDIFTELA